MVFDVNGHKMSASVVANLCTGYSYIVALASVFTKCQYFMVTMDDMQTKVCVCLYAN